MAPVERNKYTLLQSKLFFSYSLGASRRSDSARVDVRRKKSNSCAISDERTRPPSQPPRFAQTRRARTLWMCRLCLRLSSLTWRSALQRIQSVFRSFRARRATMIRWRMLFDALLVIANAKVAANLDATVRNVVCPRSFAGAGRCFRALSSLIDVSSLGTELQPCVVVIKTNEPPLQQSILDLCAFHSLSVSDAAGDATRSTQLMALLVADAARSPRSFALAIDTAEKKANNDDDNDDDDKKSDERQRRRRFVRFLCRRATTLLQRDAADVGA